jgi:hypothetical protein
MPSSYTASLRLEMQAAGENLNTWGAPKLNNVISRIDAAIAGMTTKALTGDYALTSSNSLDDEARSGILKFTGTGSFVVTIPSVSKIYFVWNACTGAVTITTGAGATYAVPAGMTTQLFCDGTNVKPIGYGGSDWKAYVDETAFDEVELPGQAGNAGKFVKTDGATASWQSITKADVIDYAVALAADIWTAAGGKDIYPNALFAASVSQSVADAATITLDGSLGLNFHVPSLGGNRTLANPTNFKSGQSGRIRMAQDATGGRTLARGSNWIGPKTTTSGTDYFPIPITANAKFRIDYFVHTDGSIEYSVTALS